MESAKGSLKHDMLNLTNNNLPSTLDPLWLFFVGRPGVFLFKDFRSVCSPIVLAVSCVGVVLNLLNIITFSRMGLKDSVTLSFFNLSVTDFIVALLSAVSNGMIARSEADYAIRPGLVIANRVFTYMIGIVRDLVYNISALITIYLSIMKAMCAFSPLTFKPMFTKSRTKIVVAVFAFISVALFFPFLGCLEVVKDQLCTGCPPNLTRLIINTKLKPHAVTAMDIKVMGEIMFTLATQAITVVCVIVLSRSLRASSKFRRTLQQNNDSDDNTKTSGEGEGTEKQGGKSTSGALKGKEILAVKQVTIVAIIYVVCNFPKLASAIVRLFVPGYGEGLKYQFYYGCIAWVAKVFESFNYAVNFFVYITFNSMFKKMFFRQS